jgi:hypothetical protein
MVSLKGKYLIPLPNILWAGLNTFCEHLQCGAKLAPEGLVKFVLGHRELVRSKSQEARGEMQETRGKSLDSRD